MRRFILAALALFGAATAANATCADTLYLQSITVYRQTVKNDTVLKAWDSVVVNPWKASDLLKAGPLGYGPGFLASDTALHYLKFSSNCGADSTSIVTVARVRDTLGTVQLKRVHLITADTFDASMNVTRLGPISYSNNLLDYIWMSPSAFDVGMIKDASVIEGWSSFCESYTYATGKGVQLSSRSMPINPVHNLALENVVTSLNALKSAVDLVGKGNDSVKAEIVMFRYLYDLAGPPSAILPRSAAFQGMSAHSVGLGVEIRLGAPAAVQILSPDGRVARVLPAAAAQTWDGRDAFGRKLSGVWIVRAEGLGAVPVMVR